jgi:hypothetical protein
MIKYFLWVLRFFFVGEIEDGRVQMYHLSWYLISHQRKKDKSESMHQFVHKPSVFVKTYFQKYPKCLIVFDESGFFLF